ncbi:MAG: O-antigen ligase family protein, partial [Anaerolineae bacterium]|nr:O-antigen ligase family protein [Anaerolineae bacterium]
AQASGRPSVTSIEHRGVMWERAVAMLNDHPTTGVGLAMYRQLRDEYPTPGFEQALVPHPHNAVLQFATDLGWVGVGQWLLQAVLMGFALWLGWRVPALRGWVIALGAGFAAHSVYGLTDAIPVWDRLAFIGWGVLGAAAAVSVMATRSGATDTPASG